MKEFNFVTLKDLDAVAMEKTKRRLDNLTKPLGSLGKMEEFAIKIAGIKRTEKPIFRRKIVFIMAGDHGIADEGVSLYPKEVTAQMVYNFLRGGAAINVLARHAGCEVKVVDMGVAEEIQNSPPANAGEVSPLAEKSNIQNFINKKVAFGTKNMLKGPAMTRDEAVRAIKSGMEVFEEENKIAPVDIAATGDMGIGNTTSSSAIVSIITGKPVSSVTGRGTGLADDGFKKKIEVIEKLIALNKPDKSDPIDILSKVGGFEIGGLSGMILKAAENSVPVVLDGFISTAAGLIAYKINPKVSQYMFASHRSQEIGHIASLDYMNLSPILDLNLRLGEGTGATIAISILDASVKILNEMATFESAGVSKAE